MKMAGGKLDVQKDNGLNVMTWEPEPTTSAATCPENQLNLVQQWVQNNQDLSATTNLPVFTILLLRTNQR
jgi:hypothetical protein